MIEIKLRNEDWRSATEIEEMLRQCINGMKWYDPDEYEAGPEITIQFTVTGGRID